MKSYVGLTGPESLKVMVQSCISGSQVSYGPGCIGEIHNFTLNTWGVATMISSHRIIVKTLSTNGLTQQMQWAFAVCQALFSAPGI